MKYWKYIFLFFYIFPSFAEEPLANFRDWTLFKVVQNGVEVCYISSLPIKKEGNYRKRGEPFIVITHIKDAENSEISITSGYFYNKERDVEIDIDKKKFMLFPDSEKAWAYNAESDYNIIQAMKAGMQVSVLGYSRLGTFSKDTYSLSGFTNAFKEMIKVCS